MLSNLMFQGIIIKVRPNIDLENIYFVFGLFFCFIVTLIFSRKNQIHLKNNSNSSIITGIILGFMGSLIFMDFSVIYLPYICFLSGLLLCYIYFRFLIDRLRSNHFILIMTGVNSILIWTLYFLCVDNIVFSIFSWFAMIYFSFCLFFYSNFLLYSNSTNFIQNNPFFNLFAFTCELFVFPYTFIIDLYYQNFDLNKNLNFRFISV